MTEPAKPLFLVVEALIGAGKSTLIGGLKRYYEGQGKSVIVWEEPVDLWIKIGALKRFYSDPVRYLASFQSLTLSSRCLEAHKKGMNADVVIAERSILTDRFVFLESGRDTLDPIDYETYLYWGQFFSLFLPLGFEQAIFLYLKPKMGTVMERVNHRYQEGNREGEDKVTIEYQNTLETLHDQFLLVESEDKPFKPNQVLILSEEICGRDFRKGSVEEDSVMRDIDTLIQNKRQ